MQAIGLGKSPKDTTVRSLISENGNKNGSGYALNNFWRGAENLHVKPADGTMIWAVS